MSRETMADILIGEIYRATDYRLGKAVAMDPRRAKRLANIFQSTIWNDAETMNRLAGAHMCSRSMRKNARKCRP